MFNARFLWVEVANHSLPNCRPLSFRPLSPLGCEITAGIQGNSSLMLDLRKAMDVRGLVLNFDASCITMPPPYRAVASLDGQTWTTVGSSLIRKAANSVRFLPGASAIPTNTALLLLPLPGQSFDQPEPTRFVSDYRPTWPLFFETVVASLLLAAACACAAVLGRLGRYREARAGGIWSALLLAANGAACMAVYAGYGMAREALVPLASAVACCGFGAALCLAEQHLPLVVACAGALGLSWRVAVDCAAFRDCPNLADDPPLGWLLLAGLGGAALCWRRQNVRAVRDAGARPELERVWAEFRQHEQEGLRALSDFLPVVLLSVAGARARQLNRAAPGPGQSGAKDHGKSSERTAGNWSWHGGSVMSSRSSGSGRSFGSRQQRRAVQASDLFPWRNRDWAHLVGAYGQGGGRFGPVDAANPVSSLDQLYHQAWGLVGLMHAEVSKLAQQCAAVLDEPVPVTAAVEAAAAARAASEGRLSALPASMQAWVDRNYIKNPNRATEKALLCYSGDVSKLLDVCRGRLLFDDASSILSCLQCIAHSSALKILRVKDYISLKSYGYWFWVCQVTI